MTQINSSLISTWKIAKEAWEILQTAHEGTDAVKLSKLQILTTRFDNLRMKDEESITDFNSRLCDIANEAFTLGEKFSEEKLVRKTLRSLWKRFVYKVTAIEEAKDVRTMKLEELMRSLCTFEMNLEEEKGDKKPKWIMFQVESHVEETYWIYDDDDLAESIAKIIKRLNKIYRSGSRSKNPRGVSTSVPTPRKSTSSNAENFHTGTRNIFGGGNNLESYVKSKGIQYRECEDFGHIQAECANVLKNKNKSMNATWSGWDSDYNIDDESNFIAFASRSDVTGGDGTRSSSSNIGGDGPLKNTADVPKVIPTLTYESSVDEDLTEEELIQAYRLIHTKWTELTKICEMMSAQIKQSNIEKNNLQKINSDLESRLKGSQDSL